jgi:hypothetical protein
MRVTVLLKNELVAKARKISGQKSLSRLLNSCLADWIAHHGRRGLESRLAREYREEAAEAESALRNFEVVDGERWPAW